MSKTREQVKMSKYQKFAKSLVKGLNGKEKEVVLKFKSFCRLCNRRLSAGEPALLLGKNENGLVFFSHTNCAAAEFNKIHNITFRKDVKVKAGTKKTRTTQPKARQGDNKHVCSFCRKLITEERKYVHIGNKLFHTDGVNSCATRYRRVVGATKNSLR